MSEPMTDERRADLRETYSVDRGAAPIAYYDMQEVLDEVERLREQLDAEEDRGEDYLEAGFGAVEEIARLRARLADAETRLALVEGERAQIELDRERAQNDRAWERQQRMKAEVDLAASLAASADHQRAAVDLAGRLEEATKRAAVGEQAIVEGHREGDSNAPMDYGMGCWYRLRASPNLPERELTADACPICRRVLGGKEADGE